MHFRPEGCDTFLEIFRNSKSLIAASDGCKYLELLRDKDDPCRFMTLSHWDDEASLEKYRQSELFRKTWSAAKVLFDKKAEAWTLELVP